MKQRQYTQSTWNARWITDTEVLRHMNVSRPRSPLGTRKTYQPYPCVNCGDFATNVTYHDNWLGQTVDRRTYTQEAHESTTLIWRSPSVDTRHRCYFDQRQVALGASRTRGCPPSITNQHSKSFTKCMNEHRERHTVLDCVGSRTTTDTTDTTGTTDTSGTSDTTDKTHTDIYMLPSGYSPRSGHD